MIRFLLALFVALLSLFSLPIGAAELHSSRALTTQCSNVNLRFYPNQPMPQYDGGCTVTNGHDAAIPGDFYLWGFVCTNQGDAAIYGGNGGAVQAFRQDSHDTTGQAARELVLAWTGSDPALVSGAYASNAYRYFLPRPVKFNAGDSIIFGLNPSFGASYKVCFMYWSETN